MGGVATGRGGGLPPLASAGDPASVPILGPVLPEAPVSMVAAPGGGCQRPHWRSTCLLPSQEQEMDPGEQGEPGNPGGGVGQGLLSGPPGWLWAAPPLCSITVCGGTPFILLFWDPLLTLHGGAGSQKLLEGLQ